MNKIARTSVIEGYKCLTRSIESPKFFDGVMGKKGGYWNISYNKYGTPCNVTKDGGIKIGGIKINVTQDGKLKRNSLKAWFMGKQGLERIGYMLDDIRHSFEHPASESCVPNRIMLHFEPKN